jgi:hypothetical protein
MQRPWFKKEENPMKPSTVILSLLFAASLLACDGDGGTRPSGPERAIYTLSVTDQDWWPNENPDKAYWLTALVTIRETGGLGGNIDFLRLEGKGPGNTYEKAEIGSDIIVQELSSNRVNASSTWSQEVAWEWNMQDAFGYKVTVQLTDDRGNVATLVSRDPEYPE